MKYRFADDCIHLKACRRLCLIAKNNGKQLVRGCNEDCSAYISGSQGTWLTQETACAVARSAYNGRGDPYDVYCPWDFGPTKTLSEIIEEAGGQ